MSQTYKKTEVIVVNDDSTDRSGALLEKYKDRGVKVVTEKCGSASKARNRALLEAQGKYIKFFDADDIISSKMIEQQITRLNGRRDAVAFSEWGRFYGDKSTFKSVPESIWRDMEAKEWLVKAWRRARPMMQPGMFLIPKEILDKTGGWNEELTLTDDFEFFARVICNSKDVLFTPKAILYYRSGIPGSLSDQKSRNAMESHYYSLLQGTGYLLSCRMDSQAKLACANLFQEFIYCYYPKHLDLEKKAEKKIKELGGSDVELDGSPLFQRVRKYFGWKVAARIRAFYKKPFLKLKCQK